MITELIYESMCYLKVNMEWYTITGTHVLNRYIDN